MSFDDNATRFALGEQVDASADVVYDIDVKDIQKQIRAKSAGWVAGANKMTRLDPQIRAGLLSKTPFSPILPPKKVMRFTPPTLPGCFNWTNIDGNNYVTPAKYQDGGTCAAYASTAALESCVLRMGLGGPNLDLAEHAIICTIGGGGNLHAIAGFMQTTGLPPENMYKNCSNASADWQSHTYHQKLWDCIYPSNINEVKAQIVQHGPVVTTMNCPPEFFAYKTGVYRNISEKEGGFHCVLVVGYDDSLQAFRIKNSWGTTWGEQGFGWIHYLEFKSHLVNFGWDIHTYLQADAPPPPRTGQLVTVPYVVGMKVSTARAMITSAGLRATLTGDYSKINSRVLRETPREFSKVKDGSVVKLQCSATSPL